MIPIKTSHQTIYIFLFLLIHRHLYDAFPHSKSSSFSDRDHSTTSPSYGSSISMKWLFGKGSGSMQEVGGIGPNGEYYFIPSKLPTLKAPAHALGKIGTLAIFPRNQVLGPLGEEYLGIYEMRYRQLLYEIGDGGVFGHAYYSQENSKLALVGTLTRVKRMERLDDGGVYVVMEGIGRFYVKNVISEKPYLKAKVQIFRDFIENDDVLTALEKSILEEVRYSVKVMRLLYPQNNYTLNDLVIKNRPYQIPTKTNPDGTVILDRRVISLENKRREIKRRSQFSFAVMDMLKTDPVTKLIFLQEPIIEKRNARILKVLQDSTAFLEGELLKRGLVREEGLRELKRQAVEDTQDLSFVTPPAASSGNSGSGSSGWLPKIDNISGDWMMGASIMD